MTISQISTENVPLYLVLALRQMWRGYAEILVYAVVFAGENTGTSSFLSVVQVPWKSCCSCCLLGEHRQGLLT